MSSASSIARMLIDRVAALDEQHQLVVELDVWVDAVPIVSARVRFADDGEPCADAPIRAAATLEVPPMVSTHPMMFRSRTDETGNAQISLPPGTYEVVAWCGMSTRSAALEVREDTTLDMAVERGVDVMGRVLQTDGQPAKGASVYLVSEEGIGWSGGETDGDGRFTMHAVPPGNL